ncbi:MAG: hypothetical protein ACD_65C00161G0002 [uncultured bacterium]|nr:MAG: hypothetical protein ACD_65C00161G0002 [uncultured bacterium]KKT02164.1 MAG: hypothetical protein UV80_C0005G0009 [Candidatus Peregrinibacteria bacterium GW2011_GWF2_43_17]KKT19633.1 MAG: hypothetical protein UW03_C0015G0009 [Candidatus Peregrinibacteria bacterium GW2011_GWA2_43_8]HAU40074.1 LPS biosynthesis protein WbpP [Candidatus Peregrinibacteria bacterium]
MAKILVTGGAGFIGSHIAEKMVGLGHDVVILDDFSTGKEENLAGFKDKIKLIKGDVRDLVTVRDATIGIDYISHHAAQIYVPVSIDSPRDTLEVNTKGTLNLLIAAKENNVKKITFASSSAVYGDTENIPVKEDEPLQPMSPYAVSKAISEYYIEVFNKLYGMNAVIFRYFNVFGERQDPLSPYSGVISRFIQLAKKNETMAIYGDGNQTRDFININSLVEANAKALLDDGITGLEIMNLGSGEELTINALAELIIKANKSASKIAYSPARDGDIYRSCANTEKIKTKLRWKVGKTLLEKITEMC